jgi:predicted permease
MLAMMHFHGPQIIGSACELLGQITTPAALLIIGSSLAELPAKDMFSNIRIYLFTAIKLVAVPLITYFVYSKFIEDRLLLGVAVVIAAMPVATNGTMMCIQYHGDEKLMAQGTFITTLLSMVSIPMISMLFM